MAYRIPNQHPLDLNQRVAVGVSIPFNNASVFNLTYTTTDQIKSNIINFILTNYGERVLNPSFGASLNKIIQENSNIDLLDTLEISLKKQLLANFPNINIIDLSFTPVSSTSSTISLSIKYSILNNGVEVINIEI